VTRTEIRNHIASRAFTPTGTIARTEAENHNGHVGEKHTDVQPAALAFIRAAHGRRCTCEYCSR